MTDVKGGNYNSVVYARNPNMVSRKVAGEMVLVPIREGTGELSSIYTLSEVGTRIWELLDGTVTVEQVRDTIVSEYRVIPEQAEADIVEFMAELEKIKAVSVISRENAGTYASK